MTIDTEMGKVWYIHKMEVYAAVQMDELDLNVQRVKSKRNVVGIRGKLQTMMKSETTYLKFRNH